MLCRRPGLINEVSLWECVPSLKCFAWREDEWGYDMTTNSMDGRVCIVTGGGSGMGRIAARELADMGAIVIINDREIEEGGAARDDIVKRTGNPNVEFVGCDMGDFDAVRAFADHVLVTYPEVHVLINNAGLTDPQYIVNAQGIEQHMAIMHMGHYLLIHLLLDRMKQSAPARIIQISSEAHKTGTGIDFDDMAGDRIWKGKTFSHGAAFKAYHRAKLAMICTTLELAEKLEGTGVTINAVSPGYFVGTNIYRHMRGAMKFGMKLFRPLFPDPERSAQTYVYLATSPDLETRTGTYWEYCKQIKMSTASQDRDMRRRLLAYTDSILRFT